ncbi:response regulator [Nocardioides sp.]|uniref:response regulator n=1 Tax=Nocardioides sp. TaxID=35761 RepID=UPI0026138CED|nr:response regulator [Nocardioides sp.]
MIRVLVVDDDFRVAQLHAGIVSQLPGFEVIGLAHQAAEALTLAAQHEPDLILLDEYLPDRRGHELIGELGGAVMMITAASDAPTIRSAVAAGALTVVTKPFSAAELAGRIVAFGRAWSQLNVEGDLDQAAIDRALAVLREGDRPGAALPKGRSAATADLIAEALRAAGGPLTAIAVADAVGVSRATAQRYLADLARAGRVRLRLRYGATGRPEHEYSWS